MENFGDDMSAAETKAANANSPGEIAREPVDLSGLPLHYLIPGLDFLPGIDILNSFEVRKVQIEHALCASNPPHSVGGTYFEGVSVFDAMDEVLHMGYYMDDDEEDENGPSQANEVPQMEPIHVYDIATGANIGFTVLNHLLNPEVEEAFPQIHRAEDDFEGDDFEVTEIIGLAECGKPFDSLPLADSQQETSADGEEEDSKRGEMQDRPTYPWQPVMWSSYRQPPRKSSRGWRPTQIMVPIVEIATPLPTAAQPPRSPESVSFEGLRDTVKPLVNRRADFLDDEDHPQPEQSSPSWQQGFMVKPIINRRSDFLDDDFDDDTSEPEQNSPTLQQDCMGTDQSSISHADIQALFASDFWQTDTSITLTFPATPPQRIELPRRVEISCERFNGPPRSLPTPSSRCTDTHSTVSSINDLEVNIKALTAFTVSYVAQIRQGDIAHMTATRAKILEDYDEKKSFGLGGRTIGDVAWIAQQVHHASFIGADVAGDTVKFLDILLSLVQPAHASDVETDSMVERVWDNANTCMTSIEMAHSVMLAKRPDLAEEVGIVERLLWCDWVRNIRESVGDDEGAREVMQGFLWASLKWWRHRLDR